MTTAQDSPRNTYYEEQQGIPEGQVYALELPPGPLMPHVLLGDRLEAEAPKTNNVKAVKLGRNFILSLRDSNENCSQIGDDRTRKESTSPAREYSKKES